jgi:hypothetical protein
MKFNENLRAVFKKIAIFEVEKCVNPSKSQDWVSFTSTILPGTTHVRKQKITG